MASVAGNLRDACLHCTGRAEEGLCAAHGRAGQVPARRPREPGALGLQPPHGHGVRPHARPHRPHHAPLLYGPARGAHRAAGACLVAHGHWGCAAHKLDWKDAGQQLPGKGHVAGPPAGRHERDAAVRALHEVLRPGGPLRGAGAGAAAARAQVPALDEGEHQRELAAGGHGAHPDRGRRPVHRDGPQREPAEPSRHAGHPGDHALHVRALCLLQRRVGRLQHAPGCDGSLGRPPKPAGARQPALPGAGRRLRRRSGAAGGEQACGGRPPAEAGGRPRRGPEHQGARLSLGSGDRPAAHAQVHHHRGAQGRAVGHRGAAGLREEQPPGGGRRRHQL
mmetsp:Transcript_96394/g.297233  ORF Transcript_96394/g.297233 Transcript_96394/m.297233 type:complete len:336 (+) Transcript_96394:488-1495(+)